MKAKWKVWKWKLWEYEKPIELSEVDRQVIENRWYLELECGRRTLRDFRGSELIIHDRGISRLPNSSPEWWFSCVCVNA